MYSRHHHTGAVRYSKEIVWLPMHIAIMCLIHNVLYINILKGLNARYIYIYIHVYSVVYRAFEITLCMQMSWPCKVFSISISPLPLPLLPSPSLPSFLPVIQFCRPNTSKSQYQSYLDYVKEIGETVGFLVEEDTLRIPSSKRVSHGLGGEGGGDELTKEREGGMKIFERDAVDIPYTSFCIFFLAIFLSS